MIHPKKAAGDSMTRNGLCMENQRPHACLKDLGSTLVLRLELIGRGFFQLVRTRENGNPWRVRAFRAEVAWYGGGLHVNMHPVGSGAIFTYEIDLFGPSLSHSAARN